MSKTYLPKAYFWKFKDEIGIAPYIPDYPEGPCGGIDACIDAAKIRRHEICGDFDDDDYESDSYNKIFVYSARRYIPTTYNVDFMKAFMDYHVDRDLAFSKDWVARFDSVSLNHLGALHEHMDEALKDFVEKTDCFDGLYVVGNYINEFWLY